jgi:hypothetical protein
MYTQRGNTFVVHGTKEYKKFDWIYGPIIFAEGKPVYVGQDSVSEYVTLSTIMSGGDVVKSCDCNMYEMKTTPDGKLAYILAQEEKNSSGELIWKNHLVIAGKDYKKYNSISSLEFKGSSTPIFIVTDSRSKGYVVKGTEQVSEKYDYIMDKRFLADGRFAYIGSTYGDYERRIPDKNYVFIDDEQFGPYEIISTADYETGSVILSDKAGNYAYISGVNTDKQNYVYHYKVHTNKWTSAAFETIYEVRLAKGKVIYTAGNLVDRANYRYSYQLYVDNKPVGSTYSSIYDIKSGGEGKLTFIGSRGENIYLVELTL